MKFISTLVFGAFLFFTAAAPHDDLSDAKKALKSALSSKNVAEFEGTVKQLVTMNNKESFKILSSAIESLKQGDDEFYWMIIKGMASFTDGETMDEIRKFVDKHKSKGFARDIMLLLGNNRSEGAENVLIDILKSGADDLKIMALDNLMSSKSKTVIEALLERLGKWGSKEAELKRRGFKALAVITKQTFGEDIEVWKAWWEKSKDGDFLNPQQNAGGGTGTVVDTLDPERGTDYELLKKTPQETVVVLKGKCPLSGDGINFDHIENLLTKMGIPHIVVTKDEFEKDTFTLDKTMMILINCSQINPHCHGPDCKPGADATGRLKQCIGPGPHNTGAEALTPKGVEKIRGFVASGGYLFTEDWVLKEVLAIAFKEFLKPVDSLTSKDVPVLPKTGSTSHPYMKKIFDKPAQPAAGGEGTDAAAFEKISHAWKVDNESPAIAILNPAVTVLMVSPGVGAMSKGNDAVAVTFGYGANLDPKNATGLQQDLAKMAGGRVLHVLSHFGKQKSQNDEYTLQNLLLNFFFEANNRKLQLEQKKKK